MDLIFFFFMQYVWIVIAIVVVVLAVRFLVAKATGKSSDLSWIGILGLVGAIRKVLGGGRTSSTGESGPVEDSIRAMAAREGIDLDKR